MIALIPDQVIQGSDQTAAG